VHGGAQGSVRSGSVLALRIRGPVKLVTNLSALELQNWLALYAAAGLCCAFAVVLSIVSIFVELYREEAWGNFRTFRSAILFLPKTWWRWQKLYLLSTPVTLGIVGAFAMTLSWG